MHHFPWSRLTHRSLPLLAPAALAALAACAAPAASSSTASGETVSAVRVGADTARVDGAPRIDRSRGTRHGWESGATLPDWVGRPLSWEKMNAIEGWLRSAGIDADPYWAVEGHLQLAEGRLSYSRQDGSSVTERTQRARMLSVRAGFRRVLESQAASDGQRHRARTGLTSLWVPVGATRSSSGLPVHTITRSRWGARPASARRMRPNKSGWRLVTVHHSAMEGAGRATGELTDSIGAIRRIQDAHMDGMGYGDIGYHFLIDPAGRVFEGRQLAWQGAHAGGNNNVQNVGICLLGNFEQSRPTPQAVQAMHELIARLQTSNGIARRQVKAHLDWKNTDCPGRFMMPHLERYR